MFLKDLRLLNIKILNKNDEILYQGMCEDAPEEILKLNSVGQSNFVNGFIVLHI